MLHPAYSEIVEKVNEYADFNDYKKINSRYALVTMAYKRAHELNNGDQPLVFSRINKPLSTAIKEIYENKVNIIKK